MTRGTLLEIKFCSNHENKLVSVHLNIIRFDYKYRILLTYIYIFVYN